MARDPVTGDVWATEHGPRGGDELNRIEEGQNYGWPLATYGREYHGPRISEHTTLDGARDPATVWTPCIAPSGLVVYRGDAFPQWQGDVLAGGLLSNDIRRVDVEDGKIVGQDRIHIGQRVRDVREGPDGLIYVVTDEENGSLVRVAPK
jgi:glucose/arabinose dehydrogenase